MTTDLIHRVMTSYLRLTLSLVMLFCGLTATPAPASDAHPSDSDAESRRLSLILRTRIETEPGSGRFHSVTKPQQWDGKKTAIVVCDMWDLHRCRNATRRLREMAPRMNEVLQQVRLRGGLVIHAPSGSMAAYEDHPARQRAHQAPTAANLPKEIGKWCHSIPAEENGVYPLDQSDPIDESPEEHQQWLDELEAMGRDPRRPQLAQTNLLDIRDTDVISDQGKEIWNVMESQGIDNVILVGVHTNMCVLGRPFGLRQMAKNGKNVVLMRDMTDTMYNPAKAPFVSHFTGTDLIVEHIEKWVCPTVTSDQILGGQEFRFTNDQRPHLVVIMAEQEYKTDETLPKFARDHLGHSFRVSFVFANPYERNDLPGIQVLDDADVALISVRRRVLPPQQMNVIRRFIESGKGVVGIRTASHAFSLRGQMAPDGLASWEDFDQQVFGGNYSNHHGTGPSVSVDIVKQSADHPILVGVDISTLVGHGSLYRASPLADSTTALLFGTIPDKPAEPIAWINTTQFGGRAFYTSLAHPDDFHHPAFNRLLSNAVHWTAELPILN